MRPFFPKAAQYHFPQSAKTKIPLIFLDSRNFFSSFVKVLSFFFMDYTVKLPWWLRW